MIVLRPYQDALRVAISQVLKRRIKRSLAVMSTGAGKTAIATDMTRRAIERHFSPVWFLVHRKELMEQTGNAFTAAGVNVGYVASGEPLDAFRQAQVCLIGSVPKRMKHLPKPKLVITDEAHHAVSTSYTGVMDAIGDVFHIGLTATPERLDGKGLGTHFDEIVEGPSMRWLIDEGYLTDYRMFCPPSIDTAGMHTMAGDWNRKELETALRKSTIMGDAIREYQTHLVGKRAICRSLSREDSFDLSQKFKAAGIASAHLDARNTAIERAHIFGDFQRGELPVLCNVELFSEGVDIPGIDAVIDLRPTKSLTMYLQFIGRALRPVYAPGYDLETREGRLAAIAAGPKPKAIILDHGGNQAQHGLPDDPRDWSLAGRMKREVLKTYECKKCYGKFRAPFRICPECGAEAVYIQSGRGSPDHIDGVLEEVDKDKARKKVSFSEQRRNLYTFEDLKKYAAEQGYKETWADRIWKARQIKRQGRAA